jgi:S-adenosylmethionine/arginine decarboxylase-like enzyme
MSNKIFGQELLLDAYNCKGNINNKNYIQLFIDELVLKSNMKKKGETIFEYFEYTDYNVERDIVGFSVIQIISLSNITLHINEISKSIYLNFFTCGELNDELVVDIFKKYYDPEHFRISIVERDAKMCNMEMEKDN